VIRSDLKKGGKGDLKKGRKKERQKKNER